MENKHKTTIQIKEEYHKMLREVEDRFGINQTSLIQFGIMLAHRFYFDETKWK